MKTNLVMKSTDLFECENSEILNLRYFSNKFKKVKHATPRNKWSVCWSSSSITYLSLLEGHCFSRSSAYQWVRIVPLSSTKFSEVNVKNNFTSHIDKKNIFDIFVDFLIFIHFHYLKMHRLFSSLQRRNIFRQDFGIGI
jgi:hypothetical protein